MLIKFDNVNSNLLVPNKPMKNFIRILKTMDTSKKLKIKCQKNGLHAFRIWTSL